MTQSIEASLRKLNSLVIGGQLMDAFDKFYHEDVVMQENDFPPTVSKAANRERELQFLNDVTEFRKAEVRDLRLVTDNLSLVVWHYDYTHREWGVRNYTQISVQQWKEGKIIKETFIYN